MIEPTDPPRLSLTNLLTGEEIVAQFNPSEWDEGLDVDWARLAPQGLSHVRHHYKNTGAYELRYRLYFRAMNGFEVEQLRVARRHLLSWAHPRKVATDALGGGPPPILVVWPGMSSVRCFLTSVRLRHTRFNADAVSVQFEADLTFEECPEDHITTDMVVEDRDQRLGDPSL